MPLFVKPKTLVGVNLTGIVNATGGQFTFPAAQLASSDVNTLDDYEEGTFTPTINGTGTVGVGTYTTQKGVYTKVGNIVNFTAKLVWTAHTGTTNMVLAGLPFTSQNTTNAHHSFFYWLDAITLPATSELQVVLAPNATQVTLETYNDSTSVSAAVALDTAATLIISGSYVV